MKSVEAIKILHGCDLEGRILFHSRELGTLFGESGDTLRSTIKRLTVDGILERIAHDAVSYTHLAPVCSHLHKLRRCAPRPATSL